VLAVLAALACSVTASLVALTRLRAVSSAAVYDSAALSRFVRTGGDQAVARLAEAAEAEGLPGWEAEMFKGIAEAPNEEHARAALNEALLDADDALAWGARIPATCARVALTGALLAGVLILAREARLTLEVVDVVALGGAGAIVSGAIGAEASRIAREKRRAIDGLSDRLMAARGFLGEGERSADSDVGPKL